MKKIIPLLALPLLLGCKGSNRDNIFHVTVDYAYNYGANNTNYNLDLDRDGIEDMHVEVLFEDNSYINNNGNWVTVTNHVINLSDAGSGTFEITATDDCVTMLSPGSEVNENDNFEESATLSNDYVVPCNPVMDNDAPYFGFKINNGDGAQYGWMKVDFEIVNSSVRFEEWGIHRKEGETITAGEIG